jgi:hypothetical protein
MIQRLLDSPCDFESSGTIGIRHVRWWATVHFTEPVLVPGFQVTR